MKRAHSFFVIMAFVVAALCLVSCEETPPVVGEEQTIPGRWKCTSSATPPEGATFWIREGETIIIYGNNYDLDHGDGTAEYGLCMWSMNEIRFKPYTQRDYFVFEYSTRTNSIILSYSRGHQIRLDRLYTD